MDSGDFNNDDIPDLAIAALNYPVGGIKVWFGVGDGTFQFGLHHNTSESVRSLVVADFNGDQNDDIAVSHLEDIRIFFCHGDGTFWGPYFVEAGNHVYDLTAVDVNRDGAIDLAIINGSKNCAGVLINRGDGFFELPAFYGTDQCPVAIAAVDTDGNHVPDLITANDASHGVSVLLGFNATSGCEEEPAAMVTGLLQLSPSPVSERARIDFAFPQAGPVALSVLDAEGRLVWSQTKHAPRQMTWDLRSTGGKPVRSGVYFLKIAGPETDLSGRIVVIR